MNYYQILGVPRSATAEEIQNAYHKLALKYHPDANRDNPELAEKIKDVNRAYQALRHPDKRKEYDATLNGATQARRAPETKKPTVTQPAPPTPHSPLTSTPGNPLSEILGTLYGGAQNNGNAQGASSVNENNTSNIPSIEIQLTQREATTGVTKTIRVNGRPLRIKISIKH